MDSTPEPRRPTAAVVVADLQRIIAHELDVGIAEADLDPHVPLLDGGLMLDSMVLFELITRIEERWGVAYPADDLSSEVFASLDALARDVVARMSQATTEAAP